ncbi:MAG: hypothetical protein OEY52_07150 [Gammaproteobacteria bacterium]|nr:hypothetical protein [Gammaproteobacteria bacterium]
MSEITNQFRESRIEIVKFIASESEQREFAKNVAYKNYAEEFFEWWFEEWDPKEQMFKQAFNSQELELLVGFSETWESLDPQFCHNMTINELLSNSAWVEVITKAKAVLVDLNKITKS